MIHSDKKHYVVFGTLALLIVLLVVANLFLGSVNIPAQEVLRILSGEEAEKQVGRLSFGNRVFLNASQPCFVEQPCRLPD